jgi:hypothetical protein
VKLAARYSSSALRVTMGPRRPTCRVAATCRR